MVVALVAAEGWLEYQAGSSDFSTSGRWVSGTGTYQAAQGRVIAPNGFRYNLPGGACCVLGLYWSAQVQSGSSDQVVEFYAGSTRVLLLERWGEGAPENGNGHLRLTHENGVITDTLGAYLTSRDEFWIVVALRTIGAGSTVQVNVNGASRSDLTTTLTLPARTIDNIRITSPRATIGPLYIRNGVGAFSSADFWEAPNVSYLPGIAVGTYPAANWQEPGGGSLVDGVGEQNADAGLTHIRTQTTPTAVAADRFSLFLGSAPAAIDSVLGIRFGAACVRALGSLSTHRVMLNQAAADSAGTTVTTPTTYGYAGDRVTEFSPFTGGATRYTPAEIPFTQAGVEQVSLA